MIEGKNKEPASNLSNANNTGVTVRNLAKVVGTPVERLLEQMKDAGIHKTENDIISDDEKMSLLGYLRSNHGKDESNEKTNKITLKRRSPS